tara:strand:+ start:426 stop:851 length:426 start_codon:yes stop_codon:yes gene_type:complete
MFNNISYFDLVILLIPLISGYSVSSICGPSNKSGAVVKFRPPSWVFGVVWPILYLLLGFAWIKSKKYTPYFITLIVLLNLWLVVYVCQNNKIGGVYIIFLSILALLYLFASVNKTSKYLLAPLLVWLLFAAFLNTFEVQYK